MTKPKRIAMYTRVSKECQVAENQTLVLIEECQKRDWDVKLDFQDHLSGKNDKRPGFQSLIKAVERHQIDVVVVWSADRLARSTLDLLKFLELLNAHGVDLYIHTPQGLDTSTPSGKALFQILGVFAEFERATIIKRINLGIERAKKLGTKSGKPIGNQKRISEEQYNQIVDLHIQRKTLREIASIVGLSPGSVHKVIKGLKSVS